MPTSSKAKDILSSFYKSSANEYDEYGEDFEESADNSDGETFGNGKRETNPLAGKQSDSFERDVTETTQESFNFRRRKEQSFASSTGYTARGNTRSQPLTARDKQSAAGNGRHRKARTVAGSSQGKGLTRMAYDKPKSDRVVVKRVMSANRNKVNALQNLVMELESEIEQLRQENRDLKRESRIHEKTIRKYDNEEAEVPFLIQKHNSEVRVLREKLKKQRNSIDRSQEEVRKKDIEIQRLRDKVKKYEDTIRDKRLDERETLQQKVFSLEERLAEKEAKIMELDKVVKLNEKARSRELKEKNDKYKRALEELKRLEMMQKDLQNRFKEKEKELEVQNIYSQRIPIKKRMNKAQPLPSSRADGDLTSVRSRKSSSPTSRVEETVTDSEVAREDSNGANSQRNGDSQIETMVSALRKQEEDLNNILEEERSRRKLEEDRRRLLEMEEKIRVKEEEIRKVQKERQEDLRAAQKQIDAEKQLDLERLRDEEKKREEKERREVEEIRNRKEKDLEVIKGLEKELSNEKSSMYKLTEDAGANLINRLDDQRERKNSLMQKNDDIEAKEQKKENLLARLKAIDNGGNLENRSESTGAVPRLPKPEESGRTGKVKGKPIFLESSRGNDETEASPVKHPPLDFRFPDNKRRGSKEYSFKKTDENLHKGLPSQSDLTEGIGGTKREKSDLLFGEYNPTIGSAGKDRTSRFRKEIAKKNDNDDLLSFETSTKKKNNSENYLFFDTKKPTEQKFPSKEETPAAQADTKSNSFEGGRYSNAGVTENERKFSGKGKASSPGSSKAPFGAYVPTFGNQSNVAADILSSPDPFAQDGPKHGRRRGQQKKSILGDEVSFTASNESRSDSGVKSLLNGENERKEQSITTTALKAVNSFVDDDIEEMVLI